LNIKEYISSGVLEAYALGDLTAGQHGEVEKALQQYPELKKELRQIEEAQEKMLLTVGIKPHEQVKSELFSKIGKPATGKHVQLESTSASGITYWKFAVAASVALAIVAAYFAYDYRLKWKSSETELTNLIAQNQKIAEDYSTVNKRIDRLEDDLRILDNPLFKRVIMKGTENAPDAMAFVYWNNSSNEVYLRIQSMRALATENQYQLWAIIDGKPVDAGVFDAPYEGLLKMKTIAKGAVTFAVTIESRGGKPSPNLSTLQALGNVDQSS
jgi:anti-sigma-K factor RskA